MAFTKVVGAGIHTQSNIESHNINSTGIITATKFDGPFDNIVIGGGGLNISGVVTSTGLDVNGNGDISGNLVVGGNLTANGDFTTLNTTLREVELLRVDANSNLAAGIITQRGAGDIFSAYDTSTEVFKIADGGTVSVLATGDNKGLRIHTNSGVSATANVLRFNTGQINGFAFNTNSDGTSSNERLRITSGGFVGIGVTNPEDYDSAGKNLVVGSSGQEGITIRSSSPNTGNLLFNDGLNLIAGLSFKHDSTAADRYFSFSINNGSSYVEQLRIQDGKLIFSNDQNSYISGGSDVFRFTTGGTERVRINASGNVKLTDNAQLQFGGALHSGDGDLRIYHNIVANTTSPPNHLYANSNYIDSHGTGNLFIRTAGSVGTYIGNTDGEHAASFHANGSAVLYWDANERFRTTTDGISVTGDIGSASAEIGDVYIADSKKAYFGSDQDFQISHNGSHAIVKETTGRLYVLSDNLWFKNQADNSTTARFLNGDSVLLYYAGDLKLQTLSTGINVTGEVAASQDYPNFQSTLDLNFAAEKKLDPRITYSRTGPASFVNEFGKVVLVGDNTPRFDHDPITRESKGLLIEESRTNLATSGTIIGDTGWYNQPSFGTNLRDSTAPDDTTTATRITSLNTKTDPDLYSYLQYSIGSNKTITHTIYIKSPDTANVGKEINFRGKRIGGTSSSWGQKFILTAEWQRVTITHTYQSDNSTGRAYIGSDPNTSHGAGAATACLFWGLQVEEGSFATSFIPTNGSTATRGADTAFIDGDDFADIYNDSEGTFVLQATTGDLSSSNQAAWGVEKASNRSGHFSVVGYRVGGGASGYTGAWYNANGSTSAFHNMNAGVTAETPFKIAFGYKLNDMDATTNGGTVLGDTSAAIDPDFDRFTLGSYHFGSMKIGHIQRAIYYSSKITDNQLKTLTS